MNRIEKKLREAADRQMMSAIYGTQTVAQPPSESLTLDKLQRMVCALPPKETWLSSRLFPADRAVTVEGSGERFTVAHPGFWARAEDAIRKATSANPPPPTAQPGFSFDMRPIEIDLCEGDSPETAKWRAAHWTRLREAFEVAMIPLPEWLRSPPKFGRHG